MNDVIYHPIPSLISDPILISFTSNCILPPNSLSSTVFPPPSIPNIIPSQFMTTTPLLLQVIIYHQYSLNYPSVVTVEYNSYTLVNVSILDISNPNMINDKNYWRLSLNQSLDLCIRQAYHYLGQRRRGKFSNASQVAVIKILETIYSIKICRRTLNYHLRSLEDNNEIKRIRRHKKAKSGRIEFHTTLVILKKKGSEVLKNLARWFRKNKFNHHSHITF